MWSTLRARPAHAAVLFVAMVLVVAHQWVHRAFLIDDAGICFTFARNIAEGHGIVPWPGGERIESVSNPTWMVLLTAAHWLGFDGFVAAKPLAALCGVLTIPVIYAAARRLMPDDDGPAALVAPLTLAFSAQLAIWSASGLENGLWSLVLALAIERTAAEGRSGGFVGSGLAWLLVVWTRPEGAAYAAIGGACFAWLAWRRGAWRPILGWALVVGAPSAALEAFRLWYFAWPLANTYYAKLVVRTTHPFWWDSRGWMQPREFAGRLWHGYWLPVYLLGLLGPTRVARNVMVVTAVMLLLPPPQWIAEVLPWRPAFPEWWLTGRLILLALGMVGLPLLAERDRPGVEVRGMAWSCATFTVLFSASSDGDWMGGYRWMSLLAVPLSLLFAAGVRDLVSLVERYFAFDEARPGDGGWSTAGWLAAAVLVCAWIPPNLNLTKDHLWYNFDENVYRLIERARYTDGIAKRTFAEERIVNLEMDQGGTIWSQPDWKQLDMASLVDVPIARHTYDQRPFIEEYVFSENPPTFAHVHGWWAQFSRFKTYPQWAQMFELPPNDEDRPGRPLHDGMWANRRLLFGPWTGVERPVRFGEVVLHGLTVPAPQWASGRDGYLEIGVQSPPRQRDLRILALLLDADGGVRATWDLPLGYGLLGMDRWRANEVFVGRYAVPVPKDLPKGRYTIGLVILDADGQVLLPSAADPAIAVGGLGDARYAVGELRYADAIEVTAAEAVVATAGEVRQRAVALARDNACARAEAEWVRSKRYRPRAWAAHERDHATVRRPIANCWARRAEAEPDAAADHLALAHRWDPFAPELIRVGAPVGDRLWAEGVAARARGDAEEAYRSFSALLAFQPWRSWARRYAEEARDQRLGLDRPAAPTPEGELGPQPEGADP